MFKSLYSTRILSYPKNIHNRDQYMRIYFFKKSFLDLLFNPKDAIDQFPTKIGGKKNFQCRMKCDNYQQNRSSWTTQTLPKHFFCNNLSWTEVVEPRSTRVNHVWLFINFALRDNIFWHFAHFLQSTAGSELSLNNVASCASSDFVHSSVVYYREYMEWEDPNVWL